MSGCTGNCCAVFHWSTPPEKLRARWTGVMGPLTEEESRMERDALYIADMLVPLSPSQAIQRFQDFGFAPDAGKDFDLRDWLDRDTAYTCRHWDEQTKLCTAYEDRPKMCADYPYGQPCSLDGACCVERETPRQE